MKLYPFLINLITVIVVWSCDQDIDQNNKKHISVTLKNSDTYEHKTGIGGDEEGVRITKQAEHFEISNIIRNSTTQWEAVYWYKSQENYFGNDYVEIETLRGSDGASPPTDIELIKIKFNVTD